MPKAVSASEAKNRFGAVVGWVLEHEDAVIVENHGEPKVVIVPFAEYERAQTLKEEQRRRDALATMRRLKAEVSARNRDLTAEEADALADRVTRDAIESLIEGGKVRFEE